MTVFYLVRHAHADWRPDENRPLSAKGRIGADRVADALCPFPIVAVCSSPARRARQTIAPLAARLGLSVQTVPQLCERRLCDGAVDNFVRAVRATWTDPSFAFPGGESNAAAQRRGMRVVSRLLEQRPTAHIVLSTHGNLLALFLQHFDPSIGFAFWQSLTMPDIYRLSMSIDGSASVRRLFE